MFIFNSMFKALLFLFAYLFFLIFCDVESLGFIILLLQFARDLGFPYLIISRFGSDIHLDPFANMVLLSFLCRLLLVLLTFCYLALLEFEFQYYLCLMSLTLRFLFCNGTSRKELICKREGG
mgnify:CR=1 FL=1